MAQAELNIMTSGHVDHGKCVAIDEYVLVGNSLITGRELAEKAEKGSLIYSADKEKLFELPELTALSFNDSLELEEKKARVFLQEYDGPMIRVRTNDGKEIVASPQHPFLVNRQGTLVWVKASEILPGDFVTCSRSIPNFSEDNSLQINVLSDEFYILTAADFEELKQKTADFTQFSGINEWDELNKLRILARKAWSEVYRGARLRDYPTTLVRKNAKIPVKILAYLSTLNFSGIANEKVLINYKSDTACFAEVPTALSEELAAFLAVALAEGCTNKHGMIAIAQSPGRTINYVLECARKLFNAKFKKTSQFDYRFNNKAVLEYLVHVVGCRQDFRIPEALFAASKNIQKTFLRWFFSVEAEANPLSGQIVVTQKKKANIVMLSFLLKRLGIRHSLGRTIKYATNTEAKTKREYHTLSISKRSEILHYLEAIGFEDEAKQNKMISYINSARASRSWDDTPVEPAEVLELANLSGLTLKNSPWRSSHQEAKKKKIINRIALKEILNECQMRLEKSPEAPILELKDALPLIGVPYRELALAAGIARTTLYTKSRAHDQQLIQKALQLSNERVSHARILLSKLSKLVLETVEFCKVREIQVIPYNGTIIDLSVEDNHNFIAGSGGFVSHNTSLVAALTNVFPDTHSEEVKRGITIKLGYADATVAKCGKCGKYLTLETLKEKQKCAYCGSAELKVERKISFLDAPGHETLMATVVSASSIVDGALLVIAANEECPKPQTLEHFLVLEAVGVKNLVVVQSKLDLVDKQKALENYKQIRALLTGTRFENAQVIPVSAVHSTNLGELIQAIQESIPTPQREDKAEPLFLVARSFDVNLPGAKVGQLKGGVLGGAVVRGVFSVGEEMEILPGYLSVKKERESYHSIKTKIASLNAGGKVEQARPGGLVGIGTLLDPALTKADGLAGNLAARAGSNLQLVSECALEITPVQRSLAKFSEGFVENEPLVIGIGTETTVGFVQGKAKGKGKKAFQVRLKKPVCTSLGSSMAVLRRSGNRWHFFGTAKIV